MVTFERALIIGNGGSGKTWLAKKLGERLSLPVCHLDDLRWEPGRSGVAREKACALADVGRVAAAPSWIIEGVYGWMAQAAIDRTSTLIWIDLPVQECIDNVTNRGPQNGETLHDFQQLLSWIADYPARNTASSHAAHSALYAQHCGTRFRLESREAISCLAKGEGLVVEPGSAG